MTGEPLLLTAFGIGLAYAAAPGAVNTEALRRGLAQGARSALLVEAGSLLGDMLWAVVALTGVAIVARHLAVHITLGIIGGCFLLRMSWLALHQAMVRREAAANPPRVTRGDFATGLVVGIANPVGLAYWSGIGSTILAAGEAGAPLALLITSIVVGASCWCVAVTLAIHFGRRWVRPSLFRWITALCGLVFGALGVKVLWETLRIWIERQAVAALDRS